MTSSQSFVAWLRGPPKSEKATLFRCSTPEGVKQVRVSATAARPWSQAAAAIETLCATKVEAVNKAGEVLRVVNLEVPGAEDEEREQARSARESEMVLVAKLLADAHVKSAEIMREANASAFEALLGLTRTAFQRLDMMEKAWTRALGKQIRENGAEPDGDDEATLGKFFETFMQAKLQGEMMKASAAGSKPAPAVEPPAAKPNGKPAPAAK